MRESRAPQVLVLACGALAQELVHLIRVNEWDHVTLDCLPGILHNRPERIPDAVARRLDEIGAGYDRVVLGYADCGTGGRLDEIAERYGAVRLPGAHCYEFYATPPVFAELATAEPGTFYLTDYLARHFDRFVWAGLGLDRHPELLATYFGNYTRLVYLAQKSDGGLVEMAQSAADRLGLHFEHRRVGYGDLETGLVDAVGATEIPIRLESAV